MNEEMAKEITLVMLSKDALYLDGKNNSEIAERVLEFYNGLLKKVNPLGTTLTPEEIAMSLSEARPISNEEIDNIVK